MPDMDSDQLQDILRSLKGGAPQGGPSLTTQGGPPQPQGNFSMGQLPGGGAGAVPGNYLTGAPPGGGAGAMMGTPPPSQMPSLGSMLQGNQSIGSTLPNNPTGPGSMGIPPGFNRSFRFPPGTFGPTQ